MKKESILFLVAISLLAFCLTLGSVFAITAKIQGAVKILTADAGETVRENIDVINDNNVTVQIILSVSGDLADSLELEENNFSLAPGETRRVYFTIVSEEKGLSETRINVAFRPEQGSGAGINSLIRLIAGGDLTPIEGSGDNTRTDNTADNGKNMSFNLGDLGIGTTKASGAGGLKVSSTMLLIISTLSLAIVFFTLVIYANKKRQKRMRGYS